MHTALSHSFVVAFLVVVASGAAEPPHTETIKLADFQGFATGGIWGLRGAPFALANLDRDPEPEIVVKEWRAWSYRNRGSSTRRNTHPAKVYAFDHDGKALWTFDQGPGVNVGVNFGPIIPFDMDGDGVAEVYCRAADDPEGEWPGFVAKQGDKDWLVKLDPASGRILAKAPWPPHHRFPDDQQLFIGYLDGIKPFLVAKGGHYGSRQTLRAYDGDLNVLWTADVDGHGAHVPCCADVDGDGKDEVVVGSTVLDDDGSLLWTVDIGHVDLAVAADIVPDRPGLEVLFGSQSAAFTGVVSGQDGAVIWGKERKTHSQEGCGEFDLRRPGLECFGWQAKKDGYAETRINMWDAAGSVLSAADYFSPMPRGKGGTIYGWWEGAAMKVIRDPNRALPNPGFFHMIGDIGGDAREEVVWLVDDEIIIWHPGTVSGAKGIPELRKDRKYMMELARGSQYMGQTHYSRPLPAALPAATGAPETVED